MIKALQKNEDLLKDIRNASSLPGIYHLWWLGQSGYLLKWNGMHLLIDPYLSDSLTRKYENTDKPHIRMTELLVDPSELDFIDVVTSSHSHTDHLDGETLIPLINVNPDLQMIIPEANRDFAADRIKCDVEWLRGLNEGESVDLLDGLRIHGIPAAHNDLERDANGNCRMMGYVFEFGDFCLYHSGDTLWHQEILSALEPFDIDVAILPINGNIPERRVAGNLNASEAVEMAMAIGAKLVIPCHYDMFAFNTADPQEFVDYALKKCLSHRVLQCGERFTFPITAK